MSIPNVSVVRRVVLALTFGVALTSCAAQKLIREGDGLLAAGKYAEAVSKYEEALKASPENKEVLERIREARRSAVRFALGEAEQSLSDGEFASALRQALRARRMPLDLEDVDLVRRIDDTIAKTAAMAEERVNALSEQGHFLAAVELSREVAGASPGVASREQWAAEVKARALEYYHKLGAELGRTGLPGSAALQLAMAKRVGDDIDPERVMEQWNRFAEPTCFAAPLVEVTGARADQVPRLDAAAHSELDALRARCGEGTRPLGVKIALSKVDVVDETKTHRAFKPLPGVEIATEEVYYVEEPYTEVEEVTDFEIRREMKERRDCAPRPGKERGCRTWTEEVEEKVPVVRKQEVQKIRKLERRRPLSGELPADKAVGYDVTTVSHRVALSGTVTVEGGKAPRPFNVALESSDSSNAELATAKLTIPADPLEVEPVQKLLADATVAVSREVSAAVAAAVGEWTKSFEQQARENVLAGQMPQAEEAYLKIMALGAEQGDDMRAFFGKRYGRELKEVMAALLVALGREPAAVEAASPTAKSSETGFPRRELIKRRVEPAQAPVADAATQAPPAAATPAEPKKARTLLSDDELRALEEESIEATKAPPAPAAAPEAPGAAPAAPPQPAAPDAPAAAPAEPPQPAAPATPGSVESAAEEGSGDAGSKQDAPTSGEPVSPK